MVRNDLDVEPATLLELMSLRLGNELFPDVQVSLCPPIGTDIENIVWKNVIVSEGRNHRDDQVVCRVVIVIIICFPEGVDKLLHHVLI